MPVVHFPSDSDAHHSLLTQRLLAETQIDSPKSFESQLQERRKIQKQLTERRQAQIDQQVAVGQKLAAPMGNSAADAKDSHVMTADLSIASAQNKSELLPNNSSDPLLSTTSLSAQELLKNNSLPALSQVDPSALLMQFQAVLKQAASTIQQSSNNDTQLTLEPKSANHSMNENSGVTPPKETTLPMKEANIVPMRISVPLQSPEWQQAISQQMVWIAHHQMTAAEIHLNPPELGPLSARLKLLEDKKVQVVFLSDHQAVRTALTESLPQLSALFSSQGLLLDQANVQDNGGGTGNSAQSFIEFAATDHLPLLATQQNAPQSAYAINRLNHLVDYYI